MSANFLIILGSCVAGVVFGLFVYWLISRIPKTLRVTHNAMEREKQTQLKIAEDIDNPRLEQPSNEVNFVTSIQRETVTKSEDDEWLNAGIEKVSTTDYKQRDDDWLNAGIHESLKTVDESSLNRATTSRPEIQIKQEGSILNITVTKTPKQDKKPEQTVINLRINVVPQDSARKGEELYHVEITPSYSSLQDIIKVNSMDDSINQSHTLMDEISVRSIESPDIEIQASDIQIN